VKKIVKSTLGAHARLQTSEELARQPSRIDSVMRKFVKHALHAVFLLTAWPMAALSGFGRLPGVYRFFAHVCALGPGLPGDYLRIAYYRLTLESCQASSRIEFGSFFAHPEAVVARGVYIGLYCVLGRARIGERTQIASGVQILSGARQHTRAANGSIGGADGGDFVSVSIGADCWIGAGAIIMADVGEGTTIGAGAVVTKPVPARSVAVGIPARVLEPR